MKTRLLILNFWLMFMQTILNTAFAQEPPRPPQKDLPQFREKPLTPMAERFEVAPETEKAALEYLAQNDPRAADDLQKAARVNIGVLDLTSESVQVYCSIRCKFLL